MLLGTSRDLNITPYKEEKGLNRHKEDPSKVNK